MVAKFLGVCVLLGVTVVGANESRVVFEPLEIAKTLQEKKSFRLSPSLRVTQNKTTLLYPLSFKTLLYSGDILKGSKYPYGTILDIEGKALQQKDGSYRISTSQDANSLLYDQDNIYLITHLENSIGAMSKTKLDLQKDTLKVISFESMNFNKLKGINNVCAGSTTPWNTHLGGEESNAESIYADKSSPLYLDCKDPLHSAKGFCKTKLQLQKYLKNEAFNVYAYGYIVEAGIADGEDIVARHYVTGKYAPETATITADHKTIFISDDGENCAFFKLVLDERVDSFSNNWKGTLYGAKLHAQEGNKRYELEWIKLGSASDAVLQKIIASRPKVTDFFDITLSPKEGYTKIEGESSYYIKIKEFKESVHFKTKEEFMQGLAFLESRKYAAILGANVDIRKEEGITYDPKSNKLYLAISRVPNNICGAVYELHLDKNYSATRMDAIAMGKVLQKSDSEYTKYKDEYYCHPDSIANPDNIAYIGNNILLIGEDTSLHFNNMLFAYNTKEKTLTRIATLPTGGEVTGLELGSVQEKKLLFINTQHPFSDVCRGADPSSKCNSEILQNVKHEDLRGVTGYVDGLPKDIF